MFIYFHAVIYSIHVPIAKKLDNFYNCTVADNLRLSLLIMPIHIFVYNVYGLKLRRRFKGCHFTFLGISRSTLPTGAKGFGGTEGFMAPEMMRHNGEEEYTEKVNRSMELHSLFLAQAHW